MNASLIRISLLERPLTFIANQVLLSDQLKHSWNFDLNEKL